MVPKARQKDAIKCFRVLMRYMRDINKPKVCEDKLMIQFILERGVNCGNLRDEIYVQLVKQLTMNPGTESKRKGWELMACCTATFPPSKNFEDYLKQFIQAHVHHCAGQFIHPNNPMNQDLHVLATHCFRLLEKCCRVGPRGKTPTEAEIERMISAAFHPSIFGETLEYVMYVIFQDWFLISLCFESRWIKRIYLPLLTLGYFFHGSYIFLTYLGKFKNNNIQNLFILEY